MKQQEQQTKWSQFIPLISVFFFWGFVAASNDILIPVFKNSFTLSQLESQLVNNAFYAAYFSIRAKAFDLRIMTGDLKTQMTEFNRIKALDRAASPKDKDLMSALEVSMEMYQRGYRFINVDIQHSEARRFSIKDGALLPPFLAIDSLGETVADAIVEERNERPFTSLKDLQRRCKVSNTIIDLMKDLKCCGELPEDEQMSLFGI